MNYQTSVNWLFSQLANYQNQGAIAYKPGLDKITTILKRLGSPHQKFKSVHIAGTNGKGSTAHILAGICIENGYKVGLFTSPHIKDFRERIKINGQLVSEQLVVSFINDNKEWFEELNPSFFEITTAMAFHVFSENNCDIAIIETGLGGRLDSTNVIKPEVSVITNIGLDHTQFLGHTLSDIASEKAGIIKHKIPVCIGDITEETKLVFETKIKLENTTIYRPKKNIYKTDLLGKFQQKNINLAIKTIDILKQIGWFFDNKKTNIALTRIKTLTNFKGRLDCISENPKIIVDASHNLEGIIGLFKEIEHMRYNKLHCIYGSSTDKNFIKSAKYFPKTASYYLTSFNSERSLQKVDLEEIGQSNNLKYSVFSSPDEALNKAKNTANSDDLILVFGSFFILEKVI